MIEEQLRRAVDLAQQGQRGEARAILLALLEQYPENEKIWLWLASVAQDRDEKIRALKRVLDLNHGYLDARMALQQLGESVPPSPDSPQIEEQTFEIPQRRWRGLRPLEIAGMVLIGLLAIFVLGLAVSEVVSGSEEATLAPLPPTDFIPFPTVTPSPTITLTATITRTPGPSPTNIILQATWTQQPTNTLRPTRTPAPTITAYPTRTVPPSATIDPEFDLPPDFEEVLPATEEVELEATEEP